MNFNYEIEQRVKEIETLLEQKLPNKNGFQKTIMEAMDYSLMAGGKRLRPMLVLETCRLFDGKENLASYFMAAMEMIHTYSLVHDDLPAMDDDSFRRGRETTHVVYGEAMGILAGDALLGYAFETASQAFLEYPAESETIGNAIHVMAYKSGIYGMLGGQVVDVEATGKMLAKDQLDFIYELKTGALIEAAMMIGAIVAHASDTDIKTVEQIGKKVGLAFQIQDDILDVTSTNEMLGKPIHSDEKNEKTTYVTLLGLERSAALVKELSEDAIRMLESLEGKNDFLKELLISLIYREK